MLKRGKLYVIKEVRDPNDKEFVGRKVILDSIIQIGEKGYLIAEVTFQESFDFSESKHCFRVDRGLRARMEGIVLGEMSRNVKRMQAINNVIQAARDLSYDEIPKEWYGLLARGWVIEPTSCCCGGSWAWLKPRSTGTYEMHGCVCHRT